MTVTLLRRILRMKRFFITSSLLLAILSFAHSQTINDMEQLLSSTAITYEQAVWFVLQAAEVPVSSPGEAFNYAVENKWLPAKAVENSPQASLDGVSLLIMQAFNLKGGLLYSISKRIVSASPRYAYRELLYKDTIQGRADPNMAVTGEYLLYLLGRVTP